MKLVAVKALAGFNYVRPDAVVAIGATDASKCTIYIAGGVAIPANEPAKDVIAKLQAADRAPDVIPARLNEAGAAPEVMETT